MSRQSMLAKLLGISEDAAKSLSKETIETLEKVNTPEISTALKGEDRAKYLQSLDEAYGPQAKRSQDMGFSDKDYYHGTNKDFDQFSNEFLGSATGKGITKKQHWVSDNPDVAQMFANQISARTAQKELLPFQESLSNEKFSLFDELKQNPKLEYPSEYLDLSPTQLDQAVKSGEIDQDLANRIKDYSSRTNAVKELEATPYSEARVLPLKIKDQDLPLLNAEGKSWKDLRKQIGDDPVMIKNIKEGNGKIEVPEGTSVGISDPSQIRSKFAAFDPRFKNSSKLTAGIAGVTAASLLTPSESEASPMSRFSGLLNGVSEIAPHTKEMLKGWAEELQALRNVPGKEAEAKILSDRIQGTVEVNSKRPPAVPPAPKPETPQIIPSKDHGNIILPDKNKSTADLLKEIEDKKKGVIKNDLDRLNKYAQLDKTKKAGDFLQEGPQPHEDLMKSLADNDYAKPQIIPKPDRQAAAYMAAMKNPFQDDQGNNRDPLQELNQATENTGKNLVNKYMADSSPENKAMAERLFRNVANPANIAGGFGLVDAGIAAVDTVLPDGTLAEGVKRFKGLFGK